MFLIEEGILPAEVSQAAEVLATRFEPEVFVPPLPGQRVHKAEGDDRDMALYFDGMAKRLPAGLTRDDEPLYANLEFLDGSRGAHVNISGISGVATKTTYATFLLFSLFRSGVLGGEAINTKALIYNVKGEDLLFLDRDNRELDDESRERYARMGLAHGAFDSVDFWASPRRDDLVAAPDVGSRQTGVTSYFWTLAEFCTDGLLPFVFADAEDDRQQYTIVIHNVMAKLREVAAPLTDGAVTIDGQPITEFDALAQLITDRLQDETTVAEWAGRAIGQGTVNAFIRRLFGAVGHLKHLVRGDVPHPERHRIRRQAQVTVVDIHNLNDRAKRFVVGVTLRRAFDEKERAGVQRPLLFVVLDELNKYAPREGSSPIKEILVDMSERGRSLGIILIGAQQTASEVERRIVANSSLRVVGRLDAAEAGARRIRLPADRPPATGDHPEAGHDDPVTAGTADPAGHPVPVPVVGDAGQRGGDDSCGGRSGRSVRGLGLTMRFLHTGRLARGQDPAGSQPRGRTPRRAGGDRRHCRPQPGRRRAGGWGSVRHRGTGAGVGRDRLRGAVEARARQAGRGHCGQPRQSEPFPRGETAARARQRDCPAPGRPTRPRRCRGGLSEVGRASAHCPTAVRVATGHCQSRSADDAGRGRTRRCVCRAPGAGTRPALRYRGPRRGEPGPRPRDGPRRHHGRRRAVGAHSVSVQHPHGAFPKDYHYIALGHLHRAQQLGDQPPICYSGSPLQLDFGETEDAKSVNIVEAKPGQPAKVVQEPLSSGRGLRRVGGTMAALAELADSVGDDFLLVEVQEVPQSGLADEVRKLLPNAVEVRVRAIEGGSDGPPTRGGRAPQELFNDYLADIGASNESVKSLFDELLEDADAA